MPVDRYLNLAYYWCKVRVDNNAAYDKNAMKWEEFVRMLNEPLDPHAPPTERQLREEAAGFQAAMAQLGKKKK